MSQSEKMFFHNRIDKKLITVNQLAEYLGVSPKTIYGWHYRGLITAERVGPRLIRFDREKVAEWVSNQGEHDGNL